MSLFHALRTLRGREVGRTFMCGARTDLKLRCTSSYGTYTVGICSNCITEELSEDIDWNERGAGKCQLTRIAGENGDSFRPSALSVSIAGIQGVTERMQISKTCEALGQLATELLDSKIFSIALVTYRTGRCHIYGMGLGDNFPTGSKIELADLPSERVLTRFDSAHSQRLSLAEFDRALQGQMRTQMDGFVTDIDSFD